MGTDSGEARRAVPPRGVGGGRAQALGRGGPDRGAPTVRIARELRRQKRALACVHRCAALVAPRPGRSGLPGIMRRSVPGRPTQSPQKSSGAVPKGWLVASAPWENENCTVVHCESSKETEWVVGGPCPRNPSGYVEHGVGEAGGRGPTSCRGRVFEAVVLPNGLTEGIEERSWRISPEFTVLKFR